MSTNWRNIDAPSFGAANLLSQSAGNRISEGIQGLQNLAMQQGNLLQQRKDTEAASLLSNNTQEVLNQIYNLNSMEDYQGAVSSGDFDFDNLSKQYDGKIDINAVRNALMSRDNEIIQKDNLAFNYQTQLQARRDMPLVNQFEQDVFQANSEEGLRETLNKFLSSDASDEAKAVASKQVDGMLQQLVSRDRATQNYEHNLWRNSREYLTANREDERRFIDNYNPEERLELNQELSKAVALKEDAVNKHRVPEDFEDKIALGTGLDALDRWLSDGESVDPNFDKNALRVNMVRELNDINFSLKDSNGVREGSFQELPYWVVDQSLKEIGIEKDGWYEFWRWFRNSPRNSVVKTLKNAIESNYTRYSEYDNNLQARNSALALADSKIFRAQAKAIELEQRAAKEFKRNQNRPVNF